MYIFILMAAVTEDFAGQLISSESLESSWNSTYLQANGGSRTSTLYKTISLFKFQSSTIMQVFYFLCIDPFGFVA